MAEGKTLSELLPNSRNISQKQNGQSYLAIENSKDCTDLLCIKCVVSSAEEEDCCCSPCMASDCDLLPSHLSTWIHHAILPPL